MTIKVTKISDIEKLVGNFDFLSEEMRNQLLAVVHTELKGHKRKLQINLLRNIYNVFAIVGNFRCEELFRNGRITFREDNELVFDTIMGSFANYSEIMLFGGCTLAKGDGNSYIILNNYNSTAVSEEGFNFYKLVQDAITPPEVSIIVNTGYYPMLVQKILQTIK